MQYNYLPHIQLSVIECLYCASGIITFLLCHLYISKKSLIFTAKKRYIFKGKRKPSSKFKFLDIFTHVMIKNIVNPKVNINSHFFLDYLFPDFSYILLTG